MFDQTRTVGARVTGPGHAAEGMGCDDAFSWRQFGDSVQVLAVADGAGSVSGTSAWGSWAATQFATREDVVLPLITDLAKATSDEEVKKILKILFLGALQYVSYHGSRMGVPLPLMNTTLIVAILTPTRTWVAEIGDGIVAIPDDDKAKTILVEEKGDGPANETCFLQVLGKSPDHPAFRCASLNPVGAMALSTDGLRYALTKITDNYSASPGAIEVLWRNAARGWTETEIEGFLGSIPPEKDPPRDDKTLLIAIRPTLQLDTDYLNGLIPGVSTSSGSPMPPAPPQQRAESDGGDPGKPVQDTPTRTAPPSSVEPGSSPGRSAYTQAAAPAPSSSHAAKRQSSEPESGRASAEVPAKSWLRRIGDGIESILSENQPTVLPQATSVSQPPSAQPIAHPGCMRQCSRNPAHQYPAHLDSCPKCASVDGGRPIQPDASQSPGDIDPAPIHETDIGG